MKLFNQTKNILNIFKISSLSKIGSKKINWNFILNNKNINVPMSIEDWV